MDGLAGTLALRGSRPFPSCGRARRPSRRSTPRPDAASSAASIAAAEAAVAAAPVSPPARFRRCSSCRAIPARWRRSSRPATATAVGMGAGGNRACTPGSPPMRRSPRRGMRPACTSLSAWPRVAQAPRRLARASGSPGHASLLGLRCAGGCLPGILPPGFRRGKARRGSHPGRVRRAGRAAARSTWIRRARCLPASKGARAGHGGSGGHRAALPGAVPGGPGDSGRHRLSLARRLPDGRGHAPPGTARHGHPARAGGLRVQRAGGDGHAHPHLAARPLYRRVSGRAGALLGAHDGDLRAGGLLPGRELRAGHLRPEHRRRRPGGTRAGAHLAGDFTRHADGSARLSRARRRAWWRSKPGGGCGSLC